VLYEFTVKVPVLNTEEGFVPVTPSKEIALAARLALPVIVIVFPEIEHEIDDTMMFTPFVGVHPEIVNSELG
jgi:hypothetical protein